MTMTPFVRKFAFTAHITFSVGWVGAVAVFLALALMGLTSQSIDLARSAYLAMELSAWFVIVPFCLTSLLTGLLQAIGTKWGLFKHYWIAVKLFLTIAATILLLLHMKPISYLAGVATAPSFSQTQEPWLRIQIISDAGAALLILLAITTISVYKPWGKIQWQSSKNNQFTDLRDRESKTKKSWRFYTILGFIALVLFIIIKHLFGGGMHGH